MIYKQFLMLKASNLGKIIRVHTDYFLYVGNSLFKI